MAEAGLGLARAVYSFFPKPGCVRVFCGKGNNAGDALVAAKHLLANGWHVDVHCAFPPEELAPLPKKYLTALGEEEEPATQRLANGPLVILDGLLGLGTTGEPREPIASAIQEINHLRETAGAFVFAVDCPSGLNLEIGSPNATCVRADCTVTFGACKEELLGDSVTSHVGRIVIVELSSLQFPYSEDRYALTPQLLRSWLPARSFDSYKGTYGHVGIIAGSIGYLGAARLCALGALHGGAGLVTLLAKRELYPFLAPLLPPEVMLQPVEDYRAVLDMELDALALGPGLVGERAIEVVEIIRMAECPTVVDAGAFEHLAGSIKILRLVNGPRILTPHPGEMERIYRAEGRTRAELALDFVMEFPCALLLKGARTLIAAPDRPLLYNTTGTPGMATGGTGDMLTGLIASLSAQGIKPQRAAALGAWISGRAAEIAISSGHSVESLCASAAAASLGAAFTELRSVFPSVAISPLQN
jgi:NAD(P)H-hydrate epimerase